MDHLSSDGRARNGIGASWSAGCGTLPLSQALLLFTFAFLCVSFITSDGLILPDTCAHIFLDLPSQRERCTKLG